MTTFLLYSLLLLLGFVIPLAFSIYGIFCIFVDFRGAPYVPTSSKIVREIIDEAKLRKDQFFVELGSGDGRVTRQAVKRFGVQGLGVDLHLPLIWYSRALAKLQGLKNIEFKIEDLYQTDLSKVEVLFLFLLPKTLGKLNKKILTECKKGTLVISHGFAIPGFEKYLTKKQERKIFPTYFYTL